MEASFSSIECTGESFEFLPEQSDGSPPQQSIPDEPSMAVEDSACEATIGASYLAEDLDMKGEVGLDIPEEMQEAHPAEIELTLVAETPTLPEAKCPVCLDKPSDAFTLPCTHEYCRDCLRQFFASKLMHAETDIRCFAPLASKTTPPSQGPVRNIKDIQECGAVVSDEVIRCIIEDDPAMVSKYSRFKFFNANRNGRECPRCNHMQIGSESNPTMMCEGCGNIYCYVHGGAHGAEQTCVQYDAKNAFENELNAKIIGSSSKPCPECGMHISKIGGCNHMQCPQCKTPFCWICGQAIDDEVFPAHFQWWNPRGCSNMQMDDAIVPSQRALLFGKVTAILQAIFLGVPTIITTALSFCMCGPFCIDWKLTGAELWRSAVRVAQQHLTMWGGAWLFVVVMLPLYIIAGSIFVTWFVLRCIVWVCREGTKRSWRYIHRIWKSKFQRGVSTTTLSPAHATSVAVNKTDTVSSPVANKRLSVRLSPRVVETLDSALQSPIDDDIESNRHDVEEREKSTTLPIDSYPDVAEADGYGDAESLSLSIDEVRAAIAAIVDSVLDTSTAITTADITTIVEDSPPDNTIEKAAEASSVVRIPDTERYSTEV